VSASTSQPVVVLTTGISRIAINANFRQFFMTVSRVESGLDVRARDGAHSPSSDIGGASAAADPLAIIVPSCKGCA
jgi:hypothetical protein